MKNSKIKFAKRFLSFVLILAMVLTVSIPVDVQAASTTAQTSETVEIKVGETKTLKVSGLCVAWESSNEAVAIVSDKGVVTGVTEGTAIVTATYTSFWGLFTGETSEKQFEVNVTEAIEAPDEPEENTKVKVGETITLVVSTSGTTTWESSDSSIATVENGVVTGVAEGTVTITATTKSGGFKIWFFTWGETTVTEKFEVEVIANDPETTTYTVIFETNGGSAIESQVVEEGQVAVKPEDPTKEGYTFEGWYSDEELTTEYLFETEVTSDITVYAKWNEFNDSGIYTVTFETNGGSNISDQAIYAGECAIKPADPTKEGYVFAGWYSDSELTEEYDFTTPITNDITLYAAWDNADVIVTLSQNTEDITENTRIISGTVTSNLTIEEITYKFESENKKEEGSISLDDNSAFSVTVLLEDGSNTFTIYIDTIDGSTTSKSITMTYESGEIVDYDNIDEVYDPEDPRVVTKPVDDTEDTSTTFVINILNIFFADTSTTEERVSLIEDELGGSVAGGLNSVDLMQVWLPETLVALEGYEGTLSLEEITEAELIAYADAVIANFDIVEDAYIDYIMEGGFEVTTNDPWDGTLESQHNTLYSPDIFEGNDWWINYSNFSSAWNYNSYYNNDFLTPVTLGIVDAGFNDTHEELNGKVQIISDEDTPDYHGTHVAGIIAATANNNVGLAGGAFNHASVVAYDGSSNNTSFSSTEVYAGLTKTVEAGAEVINFSLGSAGSRFAPAYKTASKIYSEGKTSSRYIANLLKKDYDFIVVQSAGNAGIDSVNNGKFSCIDSSNCSTATGVTKEDVMSRVLIVSAINSNGQMADFSCGGVSGTNAIAAPGVDIFSCGINNNTYAYLCGTSMAAPVVTAACGLVWSVNYDLTGAEVVDLIMNNVKGTAITDSTYDTTGGMGILDVNAAVEAAIETLPTYYGNVVDAVTGESLVATIKIHKGNREGDIVGAEGVYTCNDSGTFTLPKLAATIYTLEISAEGYITSYSYFGALNSVNEENTANLGTFGLTPVMNEEEYRIILRWTGEPSDLDSHLVATTTDGDSYHVFYIDTNPSPEYANLDRDDIDYEGPETITITNMSGLRNIKYAVHDYTNRNSSTSSVLSNNSGAYVEVYKGTTLLETFRVPANTDGTEWDVFAFDANGNIVPMNQMKYCSDSYRVLGDDSATAVSTYSLRNEK